MEFYTPEKDKQFHTPHESRRDDLPHVLIIGDSISQAYTPPVRERLAGEFAVDRPRANCGDTRAGLEHLDNWLGGRRWDLIHFNWGLHDICHRHPEAKVYGNRDKIKGSISVAADAYRENLEALVQRLAQAASRLVWAHTTFVPPDEAGRFQGDEVRYNEVAAGIMNRYNIPVNDLHSLTDAFGPAMFTCPGDVHFSDKGTARIAIQVASCIREQFAAT